MPEFFLINPQDLLEQLRGLVFIKFFPFEAIRFKDLLPREISHDEIYIYMSHHTWYRRPTATSRCEILQAPLIITPKLVQVISGLCYRIFFGTCNSSSVLVPEFQCILAFSSSIVNKLFQKCGFLVCIHVAVNLEGVLGINAGVTVVFLAL